MGEEDLILIEQNVIKNIEARLQAIEIQQNEIRKSLKDEKDWNVDKLVIESLSTERVDINISSIDVKELSGMLGIGLNYGDRLMSNKPPPTEKTDNQQKAPGCDTKPHVIPVINKQATGKQPKINYNFKPL